MLLVKHKKNLSEKREEDSTQIAVDMIEKLFELKTA